MSDDSNTFQWQGRTVKVSARHMLRFLGFTASLDVSVDGKRVLETGGKFQLWGTETAPFGGADGMHRMELKWRCEAGPMGRTRYVQQFDYELFIDGVLVGRSSLYFHFLLSVALLAALVAGALIFWASQKMGTSFQDIDVRMKEMR